MQVDDPQWVERKLVEVGYCRFSGYWYPCRAQKVDDSASSLLHNKRAKIPTKIFALPASIFIALTVPYQYRYAAETTTARRAP